MLSQGVPMLLAGDELGHTQNGNNNAYCQDNEISWLNWETDEKQQKFLAFVKAVTQTWREQPVLHRRKFFQGRSIRGEGVTDVSWFSPTGKDMTDGDWGGHVRCLGMRLAGDLIGERDDRGEPILGDTMLVLMNAHHESLPFKLPTTNPGHTWELLFDTATDVEVRMSFTGGATYDLKDRSTAVFRTRTDDADGPALSPAEADALRKEIKQAGPALADPTRQ
jgi:glycogen operon protein